MRDNINKSKTTMKIATVTTLRASSEDTISFVHYHLNIGVDHIYLFFDNPNDPVIPILSAYADVSSIPCTTAHWDTLGGAANNNIERRQTLNADLALQWAKDLSIDWIAHIDIDELIYSKQLKIKDILALLHQNIDYLLLPPLEAIPLKMECINPYKELRYFKTLIREKKKLASLPHKETILYSGEYFRGHLGGKSITRISSNIHSLNIHKPSCRSGEALTEQSHKDAFLLHYDCYNYENWFTKWKRRYDGTARFSGRENRNNQFGEFYRILEGDSKQTLEALYRKMYLIPLEIIQELLNRKAVIKIDIKIELFDFEPNKPKTLPSKIFTQ